MRPRQVWSVFGSALAGAVIGGLVVAALAPAGAATGDPVLAGRPNEAAASTGLRGVSGAVPLTLESDRGVPPLIVNSTSRVSRLNADRVDSFHANALARVAYCAEDDAPDGTDYSCAMSITAPGAGYLVMSGSADVWRSADGGDLAHCEFTLDGTGVIGSLRAFDIFKPGNQESDCATDAATPVGAGQHSVEFRVDSVASTTRIAEVGAYVVFLPFGPTG